MKPRSITEKEAKILSEKLSRYLDKLHDEALGGNAGLGKIPDKHKWMLREALQTLQSLERIRDTSINTGNHDRAELEKALTENFCTLYHIGFSLKDDDARNDWFGIVTKLTNSLATGKLPRGKYQQMTIAKIIYNFLVRAERPSNKSILEEFNKYESRTATQDKVSEVIDGMQVADFMLQERRGR
jgi:hypothetical protein